MDIKMIIHKVSVMLQHGALICNGYALAVSVLGFFVCAAMADEFDGYVRLATSDTTDTTSWNAAGGWGAMPVSTSNYYVPEDKVMRIAPVSEGEIWCGGQLAVAGTLWLNNSQSWKRAPTIPDLVLMPGAQVEFRSGYAGLHNNSPGSYVTIRGTSESPAIFAHYYNGSNLDANYPATIAARLKGAGTSVLRVVREMSPRADTRAFRFYDHAFAQYEGTVDISGRYTIVRLATRNATFGTRGGFKVSDGAYFHPAYDFNADVRSITMRDLAVDGDSTLAVLFNGVSVYPQMTVTNRLALAEGATIEVAITNAIPVSSLLSETASGVNPTAGQVLFTLKGDAVGADVSGARLSFVQSVESQLPPVRWGLVTKMVSGTEYVYLANTNLVRMTTENASGEGKSAFNAANASYWSNRVIPSADSTKDYLAAQRVSIFEDPLTLPLATFTFTHKANYWKSTGADNTMRAKEFHFMPGAGFNSWGSSDDNTRHIYADKMVIYAGEDAVSAFEIKPGIDHILHAPVSGAGAVRIAAREAGMAYLTMAASAVNYSGSLSVGCITNRVTGVKKWETYLRISSADQIGGICTSSDAWRATSFGGYGGLSVSNDVSIAADARALAFLGDAAIEVTGDSTLTLANQLTFAGTVTKKGEGTLSLGLAPRFIDGAAQTAPEEGTNRLLIAAGRLKVTSPDACNGLELTFSDGAKLLLDPAASIDCLRYGVRNVAWETPFNVSPGATVTVAIDEANVTAGKFTLGVCTITRTADTALGGVGSWIALQRLPGYSKTLLRTEDTDAGTVTYSVLYKQVGTAIVFR